MGEMKEQLMDSSGQGSSGSGDSSPSYGNLSLGYNENRGRKRDREDSVDIQFLGIREAKSQKTTPSPIPMALPGIMDTGNGRNLYEVLPRLRDPRLYRAPSIYNNLVDREEEIGRITSNSLQESQLYRPMPHVLPQQSQWSPRDVDNERFRNPKADPQDPYNNVDYSSSDLGETGRPERQIADSPLSSPPRARSSYHYTQSSNSIAPISQQIIDIDEDDEDVNENGYYAGDPAGLKLPPMRTTGTYYDQPRATDLNNYQNHWMTYDDDPLDYEMDINSSMQIVDSQGNLLHDLGRQYNDDYPVPNSHSRYKPEINRYIDHIRHDPTKSLDEIKTLMENIRPDMEIPPEDREGTPPEMTYPLMEHQKLGLAWLKSMEEGSNKGGILADDMGLGKTIQALALMVSRRSNNAARKTTLILTPVALLKQWEREIKVKLKPEHGLKVCIHHGTSKKAKSFADLAKFDVVLTTFGTVGNEYKKKQKWESEGLEGSPPGLFFIGEESKWYRVIIDEAQCIKNKDTQYAKGCCSIDAEYRLCLSGTPMQNSCDELYSLVRFLQIKPYNEWPEFSKNFSKPLKGKNEIYVDAAIRKLQALMKAILLRRTKSSMIDGKPILTLPEKTIEMVHAVFSPDEHAFYQSLQDKSVLAFNKYLRANTVGRNYSNILVLLLRLRQACCHPHLIRDAETTNNEPVDDRMLQLARQLAPDTVARLKDFEAFECPICLDADENPSIIIPCGHAFCSECLAKLHTQHIDSSIQQGNEGQGCTCPKCRGELNMDKVINLATFRRVHQPETLKAGDKDHNPDDDDLIFDTEDEEEEEDEDEQEDDEDLAGFVVPDSEEGTDDGFEATDRKKPAKNPLKKKDPKGKGKAKERAPPRTLAEVRKDAMRNAKSKRQYMKHLQKRWISSAKIDKCVEILESVERNDPTEKTIVFSQFTSLLDLMEVPISARGWKYRRYDGGMSSTHRNQALLDFTDKAEVNIILVSLKAGNSGLNLVAASQVIILDPFYNPFIESQAIDRAHRIGQQRQVYVHRLVVEKTVEDRVLALQDKKRKLIEGALDENASKGIGRLNSRDLGFLFGIHPN